jgi:hypothetical protein
MLKFLFVALLFAAPVYAQDTAAAALAAAGCGSQDVKFEAKSNKKAHPIATPDSGKAVVYVIGDTFNDNAAVHIGIPPTRIGIDGSWVAANARKSYVFFQVDPGDHRLCTDSQVIIKSAQARTTAATSFTATAGQSYFFRTITPVNGTSSEEVKLVPVDPAEGTVILANTAHSTFTQKK